MIAIPAGFSPDEYLALEQESRIRHEYRHGLVYAMAGGSDDHNRLMINLITELNLHLRDGDCQFFSGDVKVNYAADFFYYPDAFVTCDLRDRADRYVKRYPKLIAEVLSDSTEEFDRELKFADYKNIATFEEYVLISQNNICVECYCRNPDTPDIWTKTSYGEGDLVPLESINLKIPIHALYRGVR